MANHKWLQKCVSYSEFTNPAQHRIIPSQMAWLKGSTVHYSTCWPQQQQNILSTWRAAYAICVWHTTQAYTPQLGTHPSIWCMVARCACQLTLCMAPSNAASPSEYADKLRKRLEIAYQKVREQMGHKLDRQKELYDRKVDGKLFEAGDFVLLFFPVAPCGHPRKLHRPQTGPFKIANQLSDVTYHIENVHSRCNRLVVHFKRLKACPPNMHFPDQEQNSSRPPNRNQPPEPVTTGGSYKQGVGTFWLRKRRQLLLQYVGTTAAYPCSSI